MASMSLLLIILLSIGFITEASGVIPLGSSLYPASNPSSWLSPSGLFAFGFYQQGGGGGGGGGGYAVGIWLIGAGEQNMIVVWTAHRDEAIRFPGTVLSLTKDGMLLLNIDREGEKRVADNEDAADSASMLDSGNFVLYNIHGDVIWETFRYPTDTILGGQVLSSGHELVSSLSATDQSSGRFNLSMQTDGNLVLYPMKSDDAPQDAYWSSDICTASRVTCNLSLDNRTGCLTLINEEESIGSVNDCSSMADTNKTNVIYRASLDSDGVFRLYSHWRDRNGKLIPNSLWAASPNGCQTKSLCGFNSFCKIANNRSQCHCLPGFSYLGSYETSLGCGRNYSEADCKGGKRNEVLFSITKMENLSCDDPPYFRERMTAEECSNTCLEDCYCGAATLSGGYCQKLKLPLMYVKNDSSDPSILFMKVASKSISEERNKIHPDNLTPPIGNKLHKNEIVKILLLTIGLMLLLFVTVIVTAFFIYKNRTLRYKRLSRTKDDDGLTKELTLQLFSYKELKRATKNFREKLGNGGFGTVYKGTLYRGKKAIAVKKLDKLVEDGRREFCAEMRVIGRTHHKNLVRLLGYCAMDSKRLLVYEYMSNGSLADLLFKSSSRPDWNVRVRIAVDVARGIMYLHEECEAPIMHCDIKPQNILMDDHWNAKISDFGLAKLLMADQTATLTRARGTRGYWAPEWQKNTPISVKVDVFSFGVVLLEIICCRKNMYFPTTNPDEVVLSTWAYKCYEARELEKLVLGEQVEKKSLEKMVKVALWCVQDEPVLRPAMKNVVLMLEGVTDVTSPPSPTIAASCT
ncbi:hypothetical protein K2173_012020 [Erythroxylum novogranatense]|uniref:Receptor-like serine/threonine-protein kinase n=1 Tax=Erythroxylum novogranatense TaxID=1862640 RepID=A0AAV8TGD1_9ROSI|nr:hypothetical protein K2173_012020 [Erythroxylum novogranatense]